MESVEIAATHPEFGSGHFFVDAINWCFTFTKCIRDSSSLGGSREFAATARQTFLCFS